ncbi:MAG: hydantoinase B/oxoprolinase family protein [Pseudomonadales bacterium]
MNAIELSVFASRMDAICEEMGVTLQRAAFSPNIKDRLDFSCAIFDAQGGLCAQAAHIPVHLGSMAFAMAGIVQQFDWQAGDMVVFNDPFLGGTHLPDVTLVAPVFHGRELQGFVANRAHHANIGAEAPGSMPISRCLEEEGVIIAPCKLIERTVVRESVLAELRSRPQEPVLGGDFVAQISANKIGSERLGELITQRGVVAYGAGLQALNDYAYRLAKAELAQLPSGDYRFTDYMDDDGVGASDIPIKVLVRISEQSIVVDFAGTATQVGGNINCPLSVTAAAVFYVFRCLLPDHAPACAGLFRPLNISAPPACLVNAERPAAVAAGNVETSMRIVDALLGALSTALPDKIPAASQGSMNNIAMGAVTPRWDYYETVAGGCGAHAVGDGLSGRHSHMTNTLNTPVENLEMHYPLLVTRYALRTGSGGGGEHTGGQGIEREYEFLAPAQVTLLTERRQRSPWGLNGGGPGGRGQNLLNGEPLAGKCSIEVKPGDRITVASPGGGGWGVTRQE